MPLHPGSRLGSYEITALLGAGGMGEVYRARDSRLNRDVALKVLPDSLQSDGDRIARFEREAQALAALNHPNIATIHGVEDSGWANALVMELIEGPTLAERLRDGRLSVPEARAIALQIAEALEAAHEQGVVHRDLKPANIKIRPDGTVKVLDFGLAKIFATDREQAQARLANSPTITSPLMTSAGIVLGTAAYMSPEQARGRAVDKRSDIWAFGCVLYEMVTGTPAFAGDNTTDILAAVVNQEPDWAGLPREVPPAMATVIRRCLQKNPRERLRDIGDARLELRSETAGAPSAAVGAPPRFRAAALASLGFVAGLVAGGLILYGWLSTSTSGAARRPTHLAVTLPPDTTLSLGRGSSVVVSPDGRRIVFAAQAAGEPIRLYVRELDRFESESIPGTEGAAHPFFSPDGRWVGFFADGRLKKVALGGGAPVALEPARTPRGHVWLKDDTILVTPANNVGLSRFSSSGAGRPEPLTTLGAGEMSHRWPTQLPDGSVLFSVWNDTGWEPARIAAQRAGSPDRTFVVDAGGYPRYLADPATDRGYLLFARSEGLLAAPFDPTTLAIGGTPVPVVDAVMTNLSGGAHFDVGQEGTLAYIPGNPTEQDRELVWVTRDGQQTPARRLQRVGRFFALDREDKRVLLINTVGQRDLWMEDLERGTTTRLTNAPDHFTGIWSPDGAWAIYPKGAPITNIYRLRIDQSGSEERLTSRNFNHTPTSISPDGKVLAYHETQPTSSADIWVLTLPVPGTPVAPDSARPFVKTDSAEAQAQFSADGRWLAYQSNQSGRFEIYIRSFPDGGRTIQVSTDGGIVPMWSRTGGELFYRGLNGSLMSATVTTAPEPAVSKPRVLFDARRYENTFDVSIDGKRFLMMPLIPMEGSATQINVVLNFLEELRQRVR